MISVFLSMLALGLVTSLHCVSMCGPMVVTYALKGDESGTIKQKLAPNVAYQTAKIVSYVLVGLVLGAIGSAFNLDGVRPYIMLLAGVFMIILGLGMTGRFPWAARLTPKPPRFLITALSKLRKTAKSEAGSGKSDLSTPITFGLLTGLMPCAPLMSAQLAAAGSGSALLGGVSMLAFGLGTVPLMLAFGTASSMIPRHWKQRMMVILAVVVIIFGGVYINRGLMRLGSPVTAQSIVSSVLGTGAAPTTDPATDPTAGFATGEDGVVEVPLTIENVQFVPNVVNIPADQKVRLIVTRNEDNTCSDQLSVPQLGIGAVDLVAFGVTVVELPAAPAGTYTLTCGMGMMSGSIVAGGGSGSTAQGPNWPVLIGLLVALGAGGSYWYVQRQRKAAEAAKSKRKGGKSASAVSDTRVATGTTVSALELALMAVAIGLAVVAGLLFGGFFW